MTVGSHVKHWNVEKFGKITDSNVNNDREGYVFWVSWDPPAVITAGWYLPSELVEQ